MDADADPVRLLRAADRQHYLWGDDESGHIVDWYYLASDQLLVSLPTIPDVVGRRPYGAAPAAPSAAARSRRAPTSMRL